MRRRKQQRQLKALGDTLFKSMNIEELKKIQTEYQRRIDEYYRSKREKPVTGVWKSQKNFWHEKVEILKIRIKY